MALDYKYCVPLHLPSFLKPKLFNPGMVEHTFNSNRGRQILSVQNQAVQHSETLFQKQQESHKLLIVNPSLLLRLSFFFFSNSFSLSAVCDFFQTCPSSHFLAV